MRILIYAKPEFDHQRRAARLFSEGLRRHGVPCELRHARDYEPSDLAVIWGPKHPKIISGQIARGGDYLMLERGYLGDRMWWISAGFNGLNGRADFRNNDVSGDRWMQLRLQQLEPWRESGEHVLVLGNAPVEGRDLSAWLRTVTKDLLGQSYAVKLRPHPSIGKAGVPRGVEVTRSSNDIYTDLEGAQFVVAYSTTAVVQVACSGVPLVCFDRGALAWDIAAHSLDESLIRPDRTRWAYRLAYCQWTPSEVANGDTWAHLRRKY